VAAAAASGTYAGTVDLSATLTSGGNPLAGKTIAFALNGNAAGTATTDTNGVATLTGAALTGIGAGSYPSGVSATFAGDDVYAAGSGSGALEVAKASSSTEVTCPASVVYDGSAQAPCTAAATGAGGLSQAVTVTYENNVDVGTATASATFDGDDNHTGSSDSKTFAITQITSDPDAAREAIIAGRANVGIVIPPDYHNLRTREKPADCKTSAARMLASSLGHAQ